VSVGYSVDAWEEVLPGKTSTDGFAGPCQIITFAIIDPGLMYSSDNIISMMVE